MCTPTIFGIWTQQLLYHSSTLLIETLWAFSFLEHRVSNLKQTFTWYSLPSDQRRVNVGVASQICILSRNLFSGRRSERNSYCGWRLDWYLEARSNWWSFSNCDELQLYVSVAIHFICFISFACLCIVLLNFENLLFFLFSINLTKKEKTSSTATI